MKSKLRVLLVAIAAGMVLAQPSECSDPGKLLIRPGEFHGDEVSARSGEEWIGLTIGSKMSELTLVKIAVDPVHDQIVDEGDAVSGKRVSVVRGEPQFLMKDIPGIKSGSIETLYHDDPPTKSMTPGERIALRMGTLDGFLIVESMRSKSLESSVPPVRLLVEWKSKRGVVVELPQGMGAEQARGVLWSGDLNRDGVPDFIVDVSDHYNVLKPAVFLSFLKKGKLKYRQVAYFRMTGC